MVQEKYDLKKEGELYTTEVLGAKFAFRKWTWGEKNALTSECSHVEPMSGYVSFDSPKFNETLLLKTVLYNNDGWKPFTVEEIRNMDGQLGERLFQITQKINLVSNIETQNL
jgi:hypothetical protein